MKGRRFEDVDHDAWLINGADDPKGTVYDDERYETIKEHLGYTDEEMEDVDLDSEWGSYLAWQEECREEAMAEAREEALIARMEARADYW